MAEDRAGAGGAYGIDFPDWRHTGAPSTNTKYADQADIDAWLHGRRSMSPEMERAINEHFGLPLYSNSKYGLSELILGA